MILIIMGVAGSGKTTIGSMLASQFDILEEPRDALMVDITQTPQEIISVIRKGSSI
jgi:gluconate kinase